VTEYSFATLPRWAEKVEKIANAVVSQATNDMLASIKVEDGTVRGGTRRKGVIPLMDGALAGSLQSSIYGSTSLTGEKSWILVAGQMKAGEIARFAWGGANAPHAMRQHYGFNGTDSLGRTYNVEGTFWIDVAAEGWKTKWVPGAVRKAKAAIK